MTTVPVAEFGRNFATYFEHSTFRLETLDCYVAANEQEPYARFQAGLAQDLSWRAPWMQLVSTARSAGKRMQRVHVVTEPLSEYVSFELTCAYPSSVEAGEDVRILSRQAVIDAQLPDLDYWLFDSRRAAIMHYDTGGNLTDIDFTEDAELISRCRDWRDTALHRAIPLNNYLATNVKMPRPGQA